ncbi:MAG TPA: cbb3-type cytochrome oxidase assembly protein [Bacteroidota bacterium]
MSLPFAAIIVIIIALVAGALALSAFIWAIRTKQFSIEQLNRGALLIFDDDEPVGTPQDMVFTDNSTHGKKEDEKAG